MWQSNPTVKSSIPFTWNPASGNMNSGGGTLVPQSQGGQTVALPKNQPTGQLLPTAASTTVPYNAAKPAATPQPSPQPSNSGASDAQRAAEAAAEARRQAAARKYEAAKSIAEGGKKEAGDQYNWLIDTLGSNKKDLLDQVAFNEGQSVQDYGVQEKKTKDQYDNSRGEILNTYRDLNLQQEKILRGGGMSQSSRSQEAALKLNNLLGKDYSSISKNEADSLALIGNAVAAVHEKSNLTRNSIETDTKSKLDKAALDYNSQINSINNNLMLSANEKEDAYGNAEAQLAQDTFTIKQWAAQQTSSAQQTIASTKSSLDDMILNLTDGNKSLNLTLGEKQALVDSVLGNAKSGGAVGQNAGDTQDVSQGQYRAPAKTYSNKNDLDAALASGDITPLEYNQQLDSIQKGGGGINLSNVMNLTGQIVKSQDPLSRLLGL